MKKQIHSVLLVVTSRWAAVSLFTAVTESFVMLVCRGHYTIDLISGAVFGHYCWIFSGVVSKKVD